MVHYGKLKGPYYINYNATEDKRMTNYKDLSSNCITLNSDPKFSYVKSGANFRILSRFPGTVQHRNIHQSA